MDKIIKVNKSLCVGCGVCVNNCPRQAISVVNGQARINQRMCNLCRLCLDVCPQKAIMEISSVSKAELETSVSSLKQQADTLIERIESLRNKQLSKK